MSGPDITPGASRGQTPVGLAAVGLGRWARVMAQAYAGSHLVELRTCFTRNPERRRAFAADFGFDLDEPLAGLAAAVPVASRAGAADRCSASTRGGGETK